MCLKNDTTQNDTKRHTFAFLLIYQLFACNLGKIQLSLIEKKVLYWEGLDSIY